MSRADLRSRLSEIPSMPENEIKRAVYLIYLDQQTYIGSWPDNFRFLELNDPRDRSTFLKSVRRQLSELADEHPEWPGEEITQASESAWRIYSR